MTVINPVDQAPSASTLAHKHLIDDALWMRLVSRIVKDEDVDTCLAERIMDQALAFLMLCARDPQGTYGPSPLVDIGWHTFILYTRAYSAFCDRVAGRFIHHEPSDKLDKQYTSGGVAETVAALERLGLIVDAPLWANTGHCNACSKGCTHCDNHD